MNFEDFEEEIRDMGYGIVALNHYSIQDQRYTYCCILGENSTRAIKAQGMSSNEVFLSIIKQLDASQALRPTL